MAYLNKIDINGRTYYLQHLTDGKNEAMLPTPVKDDQLLLRSQVINSVTSNESQSGYRVPLSAAQGYSLNAKLNQEAIDREADVDEEQARAEAAEQVLTDNLNQEIQDRIDDVNAEEERALAAEKILTDNLAQEVIDRTNAIATEKSRAEGVESDHESRIVTMETFFKEADIDASKEFIDTLKEIQTYIADDKTGAASMTASIQENKAEIAKKLNAADAYVHPSHDGCASGLYKITVDKFGHVTAVEAVGVTVATTETEDGVDGLLSATDKAKYDKYESTIAELQKQIEELQKLVEGYHSVTEPDEPEPETE